jgi:ornithine carbamoyltransferase
LRFLLQLAGALKVAKYTGTETQHLVGREIALIFEKTSTRTRAAFEVAAHDQGAHVTYLDPTGSQLGHKESIADTARVLGRMYDGIEFRGNAQADVEELARHAGVPVYNGLTNEWHPTQMLADFLTMHEASHKPYDELTYAFVGDCRFNMGRSLLVMGALMGADVRLAGPEGLQPPADVVDTARDIATRTGARVIVTDDPAQAVEGADFIHTDVWVSMGEDKDVWVDRVRLLTPYQVNRSLLDATGNPKVRFMHCLPAFHDTNTVVGGEIMTQTGMAEGLEVTDEVFESPASIVFDQAENRLHTIKAILVATLGL